MPNNIPTLSDLQLAKSIFGDRFEEWRKEFFSDLPSDENLWDVLQREMNRKNNENIQRRIDELHNMPRHGGYRKTYTFKQS